MSNIKILDPDPEVIFDDLARLAAHICGTPSALINFIEGNRQSFKAKVVDVTEVSPRAGLCPLAIQQSDVVSEYKQAEVVLLQVTAGKLQLMHAVAAKA